MFKSHVFGVIVLAVMFANNPLLAVQSETPVYNKQSRFGLAQKILEKTHAKVVADPSSEARRIAFTEHWAAIDPNWTARLILEHPAGDGRVLWDNSAILVLMTRANEIDEEVMIGLLEKNSKVFTFHNYVERALDSIPVRKSELRKRIADLVLANQEDEPQYIQFDQGRLRVARKLGDREAVKNAQAKLDLHYTSGRALKTWNALKNSAKSDEYFRRYQFANVLRNAPKSELSQFVLPKSDETPVRLLLAVQGPVWLAKGDDLENLLQRKRKELAKVSTYRFGKLPHEYMRDAAFLSQVAFVNPQLALKFAEQAPCDHATCFAWLAIAPALSLEDPEAAKTLLEAAYAKIETLPAGDRVQPNYNYPPPIVAATGLPIVEFVAPELLSKCVERTAELAKQFPQSNLGDANANLFEVISAIARYDLEQASKMYEQYSGEVDLHSAPGFFRAMVALHPEQVAAEFELIPELGERKIRHQIQVRNAILPALLAIDDKAFWDALPGTARNLSLDPRVVERRKYLSKREDR